jgi:outer membrane protein assembly factor BamB
MTLAPVDREARREGSDPAELLIKEARQKARRRRLRLGVFLLAIVVLAATLISVLTGPTSSHRPTKAGTGDALGAKYTLNSVANLAGSNTLTASGSRIWVTINRESPTKNFFAVTELNASDGSLVRVIKDKGTKPLGNEKNGPSGDLTEPQTVTVSGSHLWVTDDQYGKVAEFNSNNGSLVRVIDATPDGFEDPGSVAVSGGHAWVANNQDGADSVVELNANDGSLVKVLRSKSYGFSHPTFIAASDGRVYVLNGDGDSVTEMNARTGALIRVINARAGCCAYSNSTFEWAEPVEFAVSGSHLWLADEHAYANGGEQVSSIVELNAYSGSLERVIKLNRSGITNVQAMAISGGHVWLQEDGNSIRELNAGSGSLVRTINTKLDPKGFNSSDGLAVGDGYVYVLNIYSGQKGSVTVISATSGKIVRVIQ